MRRARLAVAKAVCLTFLAGCGADRKVQSDPPETSSDAVAYRFAVVPSPGPDATIEFYERRVRVNPRGGLDRASLAAAYLAKARLTGDHSWLSRAQSEAQASLERLTIHNDTANLVLAKVAAEHHDFETALAVAGEILSRKPGNESALALATTSHLGRGELEAALSSADAWVEAAPSQMSLSHRAVVLAAAGRDAEAKADFFRALELEQPAQLQASAWTRTMLARFYLRRGFVEAARHALDEAMRIAPDSLLATAAMADFEARYGDHHEAERLYDRLVDRTGQPLWLARKALAMFAHGHFRDARRLWKSAEKGMRANLESGHTGHRRDLARLLLDRGNDSDIGEALALARADAAIRRDPDTVVTLARALVRADRVPEARGAVRAALAAGHRDARLFEIAADVERLSGAAGQARAMAEQARGANPARHRDAIVACRSPLAPAGVTVAAAATPAPVRPHIHGPGGHTH